MDSVRTQENETLRVEQYRASVGIHVGDASSAW